MAEQRWLRGTSFVTVGFWAVLMTVVSASLMVGHWVSLPHPEVGSRPAVFRSAVGGGSGESPTFHAFHFLYGDCPCSRRVLDHVLERGAIDGVREHLILIGDDPKNERRAVAAGFDVRVVTPAELETCFGVAAAPLLMIVDPSGVVRYSGGYTERKQALAIDDQAIIRRTIAGETPDGLPLYGCAVSDGLRAIVDPLGIKYQ